MNSVLSEEVRINAAKGWGLAFQSVDPFGWPFASSLSYGRIIFPTDGCQLFREQFEALARVANMHGETHCYLAVVEGHERIEGDQDEQLFTVDLSDYESYASLHLTLENALYSMSGMWGMLVSHEMHAVLGSNASFISEFNKIDRSAERDWKDFLDQWRDDRHIDWVADISSHVEKSV